VNIRPFNSAKFEQAPVKFEQAPVWSSRRLSRRRLEFSSTLVGHRSNCSPTTGGCSPAPHEAPRRSCSSTAYASSWASASCSPSPRIRPLRARSSVFMGPARGAARHCWASPAWRLRNRASVPTSSTATPSGRTRPWVARRPRSASPTRRQLVRWPARDGCRVARAAAIRAAGRAQQRPAESGRRSNAIRRAISSVGYVRFCRRSRPPRPEAGQAHRRRGPRQGSGSFLRRRQPRAHDPAAVRGTRMHGDAKQVVIYRNSRSLDIVGSASVKHEVDLTLSSVRWTCTCATRR